MDTDFNKETTGGELDGRNTFIKKVYGHVLLAIVIFLLTEYLLFTTSFGVELVTKLVTMNWLIVLGGFIVLGFIARHFAGGRKSLSLQYTGLILYAVINAVIFSPLLLTAALYSDPSVIPNAAIVTLVGFSILTAIVFFSKKDFSFLRLLITWGGVLALIAIVLSVLTSINLGLGFSIAMVGLAGAAVLYDTSNIRTRYPEDQYVGAAIDLFASIALMFWYVLRIFMSRD